MKTMPVHILCWFFCVAMTQAHAQAQTQTQTQTQVLIVFPISQYMHQISLFNPAHTGRSDQIDLALWHRNQGSAAEHSPATTAVRAEMPVTILGERGGVGIVIRKNTWGGYKDMHATASFAYRIHLGKGDINLGLRAGIAHRHFTHNTLTDADGSKNNKTVPDLGMGLFYGSKNFYAGASVLHANQPLFRYGEPDEKLSRQYFFTSGYHWQLHHPDWQLRPSVFVVSDTKTTNLTGNITALYNKRIWVGVSYGKNNSVAGLAGVALPGGLEIGYSYDRTFSDAAGDPGASHEFLVRYRLYAGRQQATHKYRSVRFL